MENNSNGLPTFWEFLRAYYKIHVYFWLLSFVVGCFGMLEFYPPLFLPMLAALLGFYLLKDFKFGWTDDKIRNLLLYKQITKAGFTPLEAEVLRRYFGQKLRPSLILDADVKKSLRSKVFKVDACMFLFAVVGVVLIIL